MTGRRDLNVLLADKDKGFDAAFLAVMSESDEENPRWTAARCFKHMMGNAVSHLSPGTRSIPPKVHQVCWQLARATTQEYYDVALRSIKDFDPVLSQWLDERKEQFSELHFLQLGRPRYGTTTSNDAESYNNVLLEARDQPIAKMVLATLKKMREKMFASHTAALNFAHKGEVFTPFYKQVLANYGTQRQAAGAVVDASLFTDQRLECGVQTRERRLSAIAEVHNVVKLYKPIRPFNMDQVSLYCSCRKTEGLRYPCLHIAVALTWAEAQCRNERCQDWGWTLFDVEWVSSVYRVESWVAQTKEAPKPFAFDVDFALSSDVRAWVIENRGERRQQGRTRKNRGRRGNDTHQRKQKCSYCGQSGHNKTNCLEPDIHMVEQAFLPHH